MMDINPSAVANNINAQEDLFRQGGVGDSSESNQKGVKDIGNKQKDPKPPRNVI